jgi:peptidoglycan/LPS O-acetylase OafA/YrhL
MGYAMNVAVSIPMAIIIYMLTEKLIINLTADNRYNDRVQKSFVMGFIVGLVFIALGITIFGEQSNMDNQSMQLAMYWAGGFLVMNSVFFSWQDLDEGTKIIILCIAVTGLIIYTYHNKRHYDKDKDGSSDK